MLTDVNVPPSSTQADRGVMRTTTATHRALIVNSSRDVLQVLEPVLDAGNYDVVFVESSTHAYSQIRRIQPDLVILCLELNDGDALRVLSMLKLDAVTRDIPVVTYTSAGPSSDLEEEEQDDASTSVFPPRTQMLMN